METNNPEKFQELEEQVERTGHSLYSQMHDYIRTAIYIEEELTTLFEMKIIYAFKHLEIAKFANHAGIDIIHIPTATKVAGLKYLASVDEVYDVQVLDGIRRPGIVNTMGEMYHQGLSIPSSTYWAAIQTRMWRSDL